MKKTLGFVLALTMLLSLSGAAFATDMGVQIIGGPELETEPVNLDDLKLNTEAEIEGWGILNLTSFNYQDTLRKRNKTGSSDGSYESGNEADYALLRMDITNTTLKPKNYLTDVTVKAIYDDTYEYSGWFYQYDFNISSDSVIHKENLFAIDPMYQGHYVFGCTLPNAIVSGSKPLQIIVTIDGNEITYNVNK